MACQYRHFKELGDMSVYVNMGTVKALKRENKYVVLSKQV